MFQQKPMPPRPAVWSRSPLNNSALRPFLVGAAILFVLLVVSHHGDRSNVAFYLLVIFAPWLILRRLGKAADGLFNRRPRR